MRRMLFLVVVCATILLMGGSGYADPPDGPTVPPPCTTEPCIVPSMEFNESTPGTTQTIDVPSYGSGTHQVCVFVCVGAIIGPYGGPVTITVPSYNVSWCTPGAYVFINGGVDVRVPYYTCAAPFLLPIVRPLAPPSVSNGVAPPVICVFVHTVQRCT